MAYKQKPKPLSKPRELSKREQRHYWPYLPLIILSFGLVGVLFMSSLRATHVLGSQEGISPDGLLTSTNAVRQTEGVSPLTEHIALSKAAQAKADDMVTRDYWSHSGPNGEEPWSFVDNSGYKYRVVGENLAYGFTGNDEVIHGWLNSHSHRANMLGKDYRHVGFGIAQGDNYQNSGAETVVVAFYATPGTVPVGASAHVLGEQDNRETISITRLQTMFGTGGNTATLAVGAVLLATLAVLALRHMALVKRLLAQGESFILHHPLLDATIVALFIVSAFLAQTTGFIR